MIVCAIFTPTVDPERLLGRSKSCMNLVPNLPMAHLVLPIVDGILFSSASFGGFFLSTEPLQNVGYLRFPDVS